METSFNLKKIIIITILTSLIDFVVNTMLMNQSLTVAFMLIGITLALIYLPEFIKW